MSAPASLANRIAAGDRRAIASASRRLRVAPPQVHLVALLGRISGAGVAAMPAAQHRDARYARCSSGRAVVSFTRSSTKLDLMSITPGCLSSLSMMKRE